MELNAQTLSSLLTTAIGSQSQAIFAVKAGISKEHLNRMLRMKTTSRPSMTTLKKIAQNSADASVTYEKLLVACGYAENESEASKFRSVAERAVANAEVMSKGFSSMTKQVRTYSSLKDFMEDHFVLYSEEDYKYKFNQTLEYTDGGRGGAEHVAAGNCWFFANNSQCITAFALFYCETRGGQFIVTDFAMDGKTLRTLGFIGEKTVKRYADKGLDIDAQEYVYVIREGMSPEERLLKALFGQSDDGEKYQYTDVGFGFSFSDVPDGFQNFIENHRDALDKLKDEVEPMMKAYLEGTPAEEAFAEYESVDTDCAGYAVVIADIIMEETKLPFTAERDIEDGTYSVLISNRSGCEELDENELRKITHRYAKELGIDQYGECTCRIMMKRNMSRVYNTAEEEA